LLATIGLAALALGFAPAPLPRPDGTLDDRALQGTWVVTATEHGGKPAPEKGKGPLRATFNGNQLTFTRAGVKTTEYTVMLGPRVKPRPLDLKRNGPANITFLCVYALDKDTLKIAYFLRLGKVDMGRPTAIAGTEPRLVVMSLKREKR
jgi:uncharacterized protein (TIGR03067 family)